MDKIFPRPMSTRSWTNEPPKPVDDARGWQIGKSLPQCLGYILEQHVGCDVTFRVPSEGNTGPQRISAHRVLLMARSPVFEAMFSGPYIESTQEVEIPDIKVDAFKALLRFIYQDEVDLNGDNILSIMFAGKKYLLQGLVDLCTDYLERHLANENVCGVLSHSLILSEKGISEICIRFMSTHAQSVLQAASFTDLSHEGLLSFLSSACVPPGTESNIYERCLDWAAATGAKTDPEVREVLGSCLRQIRFLTLTPKEFATVIGPRDVLTAEEKSFHLCYLANEDARYSQALNELGFSTCSREEEVTRFQSVYPKEFTAPCKGNTEVFTITTNKTITLRGFGIFSGPKDTHYDVTITVLHEVTLVVKTTVRVVADVNAGIVPVYVNGRPKLESGKVYTVTVSIVSKENTGFGQNDRPNAECAVCGVTFNLRTVQWPTGEFYYPRGQVAKVLFQREF